MQRPASHGKYSIRQELEAIQQMTGSQQSELIYPDCPPEFSEVLTHFHKISDVTDIGILAYKDLMQAEIIPEEVELIKDIDYIKRAVINGKKPDQVMELFSWHN